MEYVIGLIGINFVHLDQVLFPFNYCIYLEFLGAVLSTKNHQGGVNDNTDEADGKMFEVGGFPPCPIQTMQNFLGNLNPRGISPSFKPEEEGVWYCNSPTSENILSNMKQMSTAAGICSSLNQPLCPSYLLLSCQIVMSRQGI